MEKLVWKSPAIEGLKNFRVLPFRGSDTSWVNIFLLRRKYDLEIAEYNGTLLRFYHGKGPNRQGYGFPLSAGKTDYERIFGLLKKDAQDRGGIRFCLCDESQSEIVSKYFDIEWQTDIGDNDYIYEGGKWLDFRGKKYEHLRNRMNRFNRSYDDVTYHPIDDERRLQDAMHVSQIWQEEHVNNEMPHEDLEYCSLISSPLTASSGPSA